jgi:hypothetical protein
MKEQLVVAAQPAAHAFNEIPLMTATFVLRGTQQQKVRGVSHRLLLNSISKLAPIAHARTSDCNIHAYPATSQLS